MNNASLVKRINRIRWRKIGAWHHNALSWPVLMRAQESRRFRRVGLPFGYERMLSLDGDQFISIEDMERWKRYLAGILDLRLFLSKFKTIVEERAERVNRYTVGLAGIDFSKKSNVFLAARLRDFQRVVENLFVAGYVYLSVDEGVEEYLSEKLSKLVPPDAVGTTLSQLIVPRGTSFVAAEERNLLRLAVLVEKNPSLRKIFYSKNSNTIARWLLAQDRIFYHKLDRHHDRYSWMLIFNWPGEPYSIGDYIRRIQETFKRGSPARMLTALQKEGVRRERDYRVLVRRLQIHGNLREIIELTRDHLEIKLYRWDVGVIAAYRSRPLLSEIARRFGLELDDMWHFTYEELQGYLKGRTPLKSQLQRIVDERRAHLFIFKDGSSIEMAWGSEAAGIIKAVDPQALPKHAITQLHGSPAFRGGVIRGSVRVLRSAKEIRAMRQGEILVCPMTDPDFMPAIYKAKALVTDQGGILCHAAIVSRELKKACVIGTEIATRVLKTGDFVEVDANKGTVRLLKRGQ